MDIKTKDLYEDVKSLILQSKTSIVLAVNSRMVSTYFEIGRLIVEYEQKGNVKARYGARILNQLSTRLSKEFGRGFSAQNLERMRTFYSIYGKYSTVSSKFVLSWSHYVFLMRLSAQERSFYEQEALSNNWSLRELKRQHDSSLFERLAQHNHSTASVPTSPEKDMIHDATDLIKDPYILDFLSLSNTASYSESDLEQAIIDKIEQFLLELGKGFAFVGRQKRFSFDDQHFYVDLVFYNRLLRCFVLLDLKIGELKHQDLGQIQMYVNYYDRFVKLEDENPTIGIILCKRKSNSLVQITLPEDNKQIFASLYKTYIPSKEEFQQQIDSIQDT